MSVQSAQSITVGFTTRVFATGVGTNADSLPTGILVVNGVDNGATVTVTNIATGRYKAAVTLPTLAIGDVVSIEITATVSTITDSAVIWTDTKDMAADANGVVDANAKLWLGGTIPAVNVTGVPKVDMVDILGTAVSTPATAGILDINVKNMNNVAATSITAINANVGTTQPLNFTGTAGSALVKSDMVDIAGAAVSTSSAQIGVNSVNIGGTSQTGRDLGISVLLSSGTGTGQIDFTSGVIKSNLAQILGTALTETSGQIAAAFKKFFNITTPASTMDHLTLIDTVTTATNLTTYTGNTPQTGDSFARIGAPVGASISADIAEIEAETDDIAAIKTQTDKLTFSVANVLDSNIHYVNDVEITGNGQTATPFNPV